MLDLQGGVVEVVPVGEQAGDGLAAFVAVVDVVDQDVGGQGGEAGGDLSDVQVADVDGVQVVVDGGDVGAAGAASRKIGHESRISPQPALGINAVTTSAATSSARAHPGQQDDEPGDSGGDEGEQVVEDVLGASSTLREVRSARAISHNAARLTTIPTSAVTNTGPPATSGGSRKRWIAS